MSDVVRAPAGLGAAGRRLWRTIVDVHELEPQELALLAEAARTTDELAAITGALAAADVTTTGAAGQTRAHPLFAEARAHRLTLAKLLGALDLPAEGEEVGRSPASQRASHAAQVRWGRRDQVRSIRSAGGSAT